MRKRDEKIQSYMLCRFSGNPFILLFHLTALKATSLILGFLNVCDNKPNFLKPQLKELYKEAALSIRNQKVLPDKLRLELVSTLCFYSF